MAWLGADRASAVPLVGRRMELQRLDAVVDKAAMGRGGTAIITGGPGSGKTRLAGESMRRAQTHGFQVVSGAAYPMNDDLAYGVFLDALAPALAAMPDLDRATLTRDLPDLSRLFVGLPGSQWPSIADPALERTRLFESVAQLVRRMSQRTPLAIFLDDMHWADPVSLDLLVHIGRSISGSRVALVVGIRVDLSDSRLARIARQVRRVSPAEEVALAAFDRDEVALLCAQLLDADPPDELVDSLVARQVDTPLLVAGVVSSMIETGELQARFQLQGRPRWVIRADRARRIAPIVHELMSEQLEGLDHAERRLLEWICVLGDASTIEMLRTCAGAIAATLLPSLRDKRLVEEAAAGSEVVVRPFHPLLGETAYSELSESVRRDMHAAVADALQQQDQPDIDRLAHHIRFAGPTRRNDDWLDVLLAAAERAERLHASSEAAELLAAAVARARTHRPDVLPDILQRRGRALVEAGLGEEALEVWREALRGCDGAAAVQLRIAASQYYGHCGDIVAALHELDLSAAEIETATSDQQELRVEVALNRIRMLSRIGHLDRIEREIADLVPLADRLGDHKAIAAVAVARVDVAFLRGDVDAATRLAEAAIDAAAQTHDPVTIAHAYRQACIAHMSQGNAEAALAAHRRDLEYAQLTGSSVIEASPRLSRLIFALASDTWDQAANLARSLRELGLRVGSFRVVAATMGFDAIVLARRGRYADALATVDEAYEYIGADRTLDKHVFMAVEVGSALAMLGRGEVERALVVMRSATTVPGITPALTSPPLWEALARSGRLDEAAEVVARVGAAGSGPWLRAVHAWLAGRQCMLVGAGADATTWLAQAVGRFDALHLPFQAAQARLELARARTPARRDEGVGGVSEGDAAEIAALLNAALAVFHRFDARADADRARRGLRDLGVTPPTAQRARTAGSLMLSARESEVVALVVAGLSNAEIADRLFISPRTVTTHLQHVYQRHGLGSRTALVGWAVARGIAAPDSRSGSRAKGSPADD